MARARQWCTSANHRLLLPGGPGGLAAAEQEQKFWGSTTSSRGGPVDRHPNTLSRPSSTSQAAGCPTWFRTTMLADHTVWSEVRQRSRHQAGITGTPTMFINKAHSGFPRRHLRACTVLAQLAETAS